MSDEPSTANESPSDETDASSAANDSHWTKIDRYALIAVVLVASVLRLWNLSHPPELIFDETYYAKDACWYVLHDADTCLRDGTSPEVHPPLGKWLIAIGIRIWGFDCPNPDEACRGATTSFGWRILPALAGIATVALLYLLARRLFRSTLAASLASGLLALDFLHLVQSRTSMLDIFVPLFGIAGFLFLVYDRAQREEREPPRSILERPWLLAAGVAFGAAAATKWSGVLYLLAGAAVAIGLAVGFHRRDGEGWLRRGLRAEVAPLVLYLVVAPIAIYLLTYIGRIEGNLLAAPWVQGSWFRSLWDHHNYMLDFHTQLESNHSYQSPPWTWLL
ncbi:MAG TPA: phospholipid carrier-dependent glycosyltransferase, partial [Actinomycetota bacterium]|nr:phospholipid carrier-dependent glycosyltransferase [Actinomycetota bacterium]